MGELSELTNAKARLQQLAAEKQQLLAVRSLEQEAHSAELEKLHSAHAAEAAELRSALAASESERERLASVVRQHNGGTTVLHDQSSSSTNVLSRVANDDSQAENLGTNPADSTDPMSAKMLAKQASMIVALREQLEANRLAALKDKQAAVDKVRSKAKALIRQNGAERRQAEAQIAELKAQLQQQ
jgi:hypothetical protein